MARDPGRMVVLGIPPTRPDTGFGYIERTGSALDVKRLSCLRRASIHGKTRARSREGICRLRAAISGTPECFSGASRHFSKIWSIILPKTHAALESLAETIGKKTYDRQLARHLSASSKIFPSTTPFSNRATRDARQPARLRDSRRGRLERYRLLGRRLRIARKTTSGRKYFCDSAGHTRSTPTAISSGARRNSSPPSASRDLVVVETADALLICPRDRAQDVGKIVKWLEEAKREKLL